MKCRHRHSWLFAGGSYEWCYQCGAIRRMEKVGITQCSPVTAWCKPTGANGENPWYRWNLRNITYQARKAAK